MPSIRQKVKGIKYGTMESYNQIRTKDPDMLYFITDKGLLYRGESIVVPKNFVQVTQNAGTSPSYHFNVETYGNGGQQGQTLAFDVYSVAAVNAIVDTLHTAIANHAATLAHSRQVGHVALSDAIDDNTHDADWALDPSHTETYAATPAAVARALAAANAYTDQQIADIAGAMVFKGTIGAAAEYDATHTYHPGDYCEHDGGLYRCTAADDVHGQWDATQWTQVQRTAAALPAAYAIGWTYRVVAPGTYAGAPCEVGDMLICVSASAQGQQQAADDDWTVAQSNIDGAVTAEQDLPAATLVLGNGGKTVKKMAPGTQGTFLRQGANGPEWGRAIPADIGNAVGNATNNGNGRFLADLTALDPEKGSIVALTFGSDVPAGARLKVGSTGFLNILHAGANIAAGVVMQGDTATLAYDNSTGTARWVLLAVDRQAPSSLQGFENNLIMRGTCNTAAATADKVADIAAGSAQGMLVAIRFTYDVPAAATLKLNADEASAHAVMHRGAAIAANAIRGGDTATLVYDASSGTGLWHLLAVDRPFDSTPTSGSHNLVDSDAVYQAIENATLYWEEI